MARGKAVRGDPIDDGAGYEEALGEAGETFGDGGGGLGEALGGNDENDRQPGDPRQRGRRTGAACAAVIETHDAFDEHEVGALAEPGKPRLDRLRAHPPGIEVEGGAPARRLKE